MASYDIQRGPISVGSTKTGSTYVKNIAVKYRNITDGLSQTVVLGEAVVGTQSLTSTFPAGVGKLAQDSSTAPASCLSLLSSNQYSSTISDSRYQPGSNWAPSGTAYTGFVMNAAPNTPRCVVDQDWSPTIMPASSYHPGGVYVTMCDASVRFVADQIDAGTSTAQQTDNSGNANGNARFYTKESIRGVWGAMSTIKGGESLRME